MSDPKVTHQPSHPLCCAVFGCSDWACFGFGQVRGQPEAGLWVCGSPLHRAWAMGVLEARALANKVPLSREKGAANAFSPKPAPPAPESLFDEEAA